ncbi:carboxymuconolactone decarboxylase family protein [Nocardiopsis sp. N85]|uniref:carboxymuconolactone decarboxylase family protein n=1 Tax=Nocardiopsis sp. N85 TaxID=3029400 RepID=UPI00237F1943|nr:carboxymuconolactone decarboxylase family protein [Nocardiopsis sp. N85]MDE3722967.1 carboxymuconolactone decarboxylase family protein [Nocardiopsis sp. N85]
MQTVQARMGNPAMTVPGAMPALMALGKSVQKAGVPKTTLELVNLRASQINGCAVCVHMHSSDLSKAGESNERVFAVAAWRDAPFFTDAERAALALAESVTRVGDSSEQVSDEVWEEVSRHYDEAAVAALVLAIATVNLWNRVNAATRQVAGAAWA